MSESEAVRAYTRKLGLLKACLQGDKFEYIALKDTSAEEYASFADLKEADGCTPQQLKDYVSDLESKDGRIFHFFIKERDKLGYVAAVNIMLLPGSKTATIGFMVKESERGRGLATEITRFVCEAIGRKAKLLGIRQITAEVCPPNEKSERVLQRSGFSCEGVAPTTYTTEIDGSQMDIAGKDVLLYHYSPQKARTR